MTFPEIRRQYITSNPVYKSGQISKRFNKNYVKREVCCFGNLYITGHSTMDHIISDAIVSLPGTRKRIGERMFR